MKTFSSRSHLTCGTVLLKNKTKIILFQSFQVIASKGKKKKETLVPKWYHVHYSDASHWRGHNEKEGKEPIKAIINPQVMEVGLTQVAYSHALFMTSPSLRPKVCVFFSGGVVRLSGAQMHLLNGEQFIQLKCFDQELIALYCTGRRTANHTT